MLRVSRDCYYEWIPETDYTDSCHLRRDLCCRCCLIRLVKFHFQFSESLLRRCLFRFQIFNHRLKPFSTDIKQFYNHQPRPLESACFVSPCRPLESACFVSHWSVVNDRMNRNTDLKTNNNGSWDAWVRQLALTFWSSLNEADRRLKTRVTGLRVSGHRLVGLESAIPV